MLMVCTNYILIVWIKKKSDIPITFITIVAIITVALGCLECTDLR